MQDGLRESAARLLLIPGLMHFLLTGKAAIEYTNATTTQMVNARTGEWDHELLASLNLPQHLLPEIVPAGTNFGPLEAPLAREVQLVGARVVAPATHDTASAVIGAPFEDGFAYISSGTWSLVGVERDSPIINSEAGRRNFTNEGGAFGTVRFLKNVMALWILESCRNEWQENGLDTDYDSLFAQVCAMEGAPCFVFPDDPRFFSPLSMLEALSQHLTETGQCVPADLPALTKVILDSLAFRYASVLNGIQCLTGQRIRGVHIVGGGSRNDYLNQMTANGYRSARVGRTSRSNCHRKRPGSGDCIRTFRLVGRRPGILGFQCASQKVHAAPDIRFRRGTPTSCGHRGAMIEDEASVLVERTPS